MLNPKLYNALNKMFGDVRISREDDEAEYSIPAGRYSCFTPKQNKYADLEDWGESYEVSCPVCGDTRHRLRFCHLWGEKVIPKGTKKPVYFGKYCMHCYNEECHKTEKIWTHLNKLDFTSTEVEVAASYTAKNVPFKKMLDIEIPVVKGALPLIDSALPGYVRDYLQERHFYIQELNDHYMCKYIPAGLDWHNEDKSKTVSFYEDRLFIPIIQRQVQVSWQARRIVENGMPLKYLFPPGCRKSTYVYNMDNALLHNEIVICEGVTDVWRIGPHAVAIFGKSLSLAQLEIMRVLWGFDGKAVIALDPDAKKAAHNIAKMLRFKEIFPGGVSVLDLEKGDPDNYSREEINSLISEKMKETHN